MTSIIHIEETASTNSYLKQLLVDKNLEEYTVVITNHQTAGRGQRGNRWESEKGKNLTFSILLHPFFIPINEQFIISQIVSLAIVETLNRYKEGFTIKWPNDIYWQEDKVCGILIENTLSENQIQDTIVGIGLNVNQDTFQSDAPNPISLKQILGQSTDSNEILLLFIKTLRQYYDQLRNNTNNEIGNKYIALSFRRDGYYLYEDEDGKFSARIYNIELDGYLVLEMEDGKRKRFAFKEVKYI